jgi:hypothetical protein
MPICPDCHVPTNKPTESGWGTVPLITCREGATFMSTNRNGSVTGYDGEHGRGRRWPDPAT